VAKQLRAGRLKTVPEFFLCYPSRAQSSPALRLSVEVAKELLGPRSKEGESAAAHKAVTG
jgi:hypothetical protein